jgi:hypothetical protein
MQAVEFRNKPITTARDAIASHVRWKITLVMAARMREPLSDRATHSIAHPDECSIRQWLVSTHTLPIRHTPEYRCVLDRHLEFHRAMQAVARLINSGEYAAAERLLNAPAGFLHASTAVANAIMALGRIQMAQPAG